MSTGPLRFTIEPPPPPRTLEVGWLAHARLRQHARDPGSPIARRYQPEFPASLTGIPIRQRQDLAPEAWRLTQGDDVIQEGAL